MKFDASCDECLRLYVDEILTRIWFYPKPVRNFTPHEIEKRIAARFGVKV